MTETRSASRATKIRRRAVAFIAVVTAAAVGAGTAAPSAQAYPRECSAVRADYSYHMNWYYAHAGWGNWPLAYDNLALAQAARGYGQELGCWA